MMCLNFCIKGYTGRNDESKHAKIVAIEARLAERPWAWHLGKHLVSDLPEVLSLLEECMQTCNAKTVPDQESRQLEQAAKKAEDLASRLLGKPWCEEAILAKVPGWQDNQDWELSTQEIYLPNRNLYEWNRVPYLGRGFLSLPATLEHLGEQLLAVSKGATTTASVFHQLLDMYALAACSKHLAAPLLSKRLRRQRRFKHLASSMADLVASHSHVLNLRVAELLQEHGRA
jgi:hypothetical protein